MARSWFYYLHSDIIFPSNFKLDIYMNFVRLLPAILSTFLITAHFSRAGMDTLAIVILLLPFTFFIKKPYVLRIWQFCLTIAGLIWIKTGIEIIQLRLAAEQPWLRLVIIIGLIVAFNGFAAIWMENKKIKSFFGFEGESTS